MSTRQPADNRSGGVCHAGASVDDSRLFRFGSLLVTCHSSLVTALWTSDAGLGTPPVSLITALPTPRVTRPCSCAVPASHARCDRKWSEFGAIWASIDFDLTSIYGTTTCLFINIVAFASKNQQLVYFHQDRWSNRPLPKFLLCFHTDRGSDQKISFLLAWGSILSLESDIVADRTIDAGRDFPFFECQTFYRPWEPSMASSAGDFDSRRARPGVFYQHPIPSATSPRLHHLG